MKKYGDLTKTEHEFLGHDRFAYPEGVLRVTSGHGGESILILGKNKVALYDTGMAYCGEKTARNIRKILNGRKLDYVLASHTHYDHIGAIPYIKLAFPDAEVLGAEYAKYVFTRAGAHRVIKQLGIVADKLYGENNPEQIITDGMAVDKVVSDGDVIDLGGERIRVLETKGHTDCSLSFYLEDKSLLFASESTGICGGPGFCSTAILKSFDDSMQSLKKCRELNPEKIVSPHFGMVPTEYNNTYWDIFEEAALNERDYCVKLWKEGLTTEEMLRRATEDFYGEERSKEQPYEAFVANAIQTFKVYKDCR